MDFATYILNFAKYIRDEGAITVMTRNGTNKGNRNCTGDAATRCSFYAPEHIEEGKHNVFTIKKEPERLLLVIAPAHALAI